MTDQHPITPPPELVQQWREAPEFFELSPCALVTVTTTKLQDIATQSAQWGADQELEACVKWLNSYMPGKTGDQLLRPFRRSKPQSLKEQALAAAAELEGFKGVDIIRRALEALPDPS